MTTTETTSAVQVNRKGKKFLHKKVVVRLIAEAAVTTATTDLLSEFVQTFDRTMLRLSFSGGAGVSAGTTGTLTVETAQTTGATVRTVQTSSGAMSLEFGSTHNSANLRATFIGLDNYTRVRAALAGDSATSTGIFCDGEFV